MTNVIRNGWRARVFAIFFLACYALYPVRGTLFNYFIAGYTRFGRALWNYIYENSNDLAALTFLPLSMAIALALTEKKGWVRLAALAGCGVLPLVILLTQSRGALIALVVSMLLFFIMHSSKKRLRTFLTAVALAVFTLPFVPDSAWERFSGLIKLGDETTIREADPEGSAEARYTIWGVANTIISDNPITGVGLGAYPTAHARYAERMDITLAAKGPRDTHSTYLNIGAEMGLVGLAIFIAMIATAYIDAEITRRRAKHLPRSHQILALQLGLVAFLLASVFGSYSKLAFLYVQLAFLWVTTNLTKMELANAVATTARGPRRRGGLA
jgi:O-antigen ligase